MTRRKMNWQWRVAHLLGFLAALIPVYVLWPVGVVTIDGTTPQRISNRQVGPGQVLLWVRKGTTCFPDGWVLVRQTVKTQLPDGSPFWYPSDGPLLNRQGACVEDNLIAWEMPTNLVIPGPFVVEFRFCSNPDRWARERCTTATSPEFELVTDFQPTPMKEDGS